MHRFMYRIARFLQICSPSLDKTCILLQTYNNLPFIVLNFWSIGRAEQYAKKQTNILITLFWQMWLQYESKMMWLFLRSVPNKHVHLCLENMISHKASFIMLCCAIWIMFWLIFWFWLISFKSVLLKQISFSVISYF